MLKHFTVFTALILTVFVVGCSEYTEIFIEEVNILPTGDGGDVSWLDDIDFPLDDLPIDGWDDPVPQDDDTTPPMIVESSVLDGETEVDPFVLNENGIQITFDEHVYGEVQLALQDGTTDVTYSPIDWDSVVEGDIAELRLTEGNELKYATTYVIYVAVGDAAGNFTEYVIRFVTGGAPESTN